MMAVDRDGRNISVLTDPIRLNSSLDGTRVRPDISPDGQTVLYVVSGRDARHVVDSPLGRQRRSDGIPLHAALGLRAGRRAGRVQPGRIGDRLPRLDGGGHGTVECELAVRAMSADGSNDRVVFGPINRGVESVAADLRRARLEGRPHPVQLAHARIGATPISQPRVGRERDLGRDPPRGVRTGRRGRRLLPTLARRAVGRLPDMYHSPQPLGRGAPPGQRRPRPRPGAVYQHGTRPLLRLGGRGAGPGAGRGWRSGRT